MDPQKPVDPAQVKLDKGGSGAADTGAKSTSAAAASGGACAASSFKQVLLVGFFVLFVVGNVTALYILHFVNRPSPTTRFTFEAFTATADTSPQEGDVVSLSSAAMLRNGAGTTAYLSTMKLSDGEFYEYVNFAPLGTSKSAYTTNLLGYARTTGTTLESVLTTFTVGTTDTNKTLTSSSIPSSNVIANEYIRGIATISDSLAVALTIQPFGSSATYSTFITPVTISGTTATMVQGSRIKTTDYSATNFVAALPGSSAFVIAYYDKYIDATTPYSQRVKVGVVDPATNAVTLLATTPAFGIDNNANYMTNFGKPQAVGKDGMFVIPYFQTSWNAALASTLSGLCVTSSKFSSSAKTIAAFSTGVCQTKFQPKYLIDSVMLSDNVLAIAFHDSANNNALTIATVAISSYDSSMRFRTSYVLTEVGGTFEFGAGSPYGFSPKPSLAKLSGDRVVVSFLNPSQSGKLSVKVLHYSPDTLAFKDVTPVMPLAALDFSLIVEANGRDKAVTQEVIPVSDDGVVTAYLGKRGTTVHQRFSVVEDFGAPVGILRKYNGKAKASVAISGKADVSSKLTVGQVYYATTTGAVVAATSSSGEYAYSTDGSLLMTTSSKVGIAVSKDQLFVNTAMN